MIIDIPTAKDFKDSGVDFLNLAWDRLIGVLSDMYHLTEHKRLNDSASYTDQDRTYLLQSQRELATALTLTLQGVEFLLKGRIVSISPYLLILTDQQNRPKKANIQNKRFAEFKTVPAADLASLHNMVCGERLDEACQRLINQIRIQRNSIMHTVDNSMYLNIEKLALNILELYHHLVEPKGWMSARNNFISREAIGAYFPEDSLWGHEHHLSQQHIQLINEIEVVFALLTKRQKVSYFGFDTTQKSFACPHCLYVLHDNYGDFDDLPKLAQIVDQGEGDDGRYVKLHCIICQEDHQVWMYPCPNNDCKDELVDEWMNCLECGDVVKEL